MLLLKVPHYIKATYIRTKVPNSFSKRMKLLHTLIEHVMLKERTLGGLWAAFWPLGQTAGIFFGISALSFGSGANHSGKYYSLDTSLFFANFKSNCREKCLFSQMEHAVSKKGLSC